MANEPIHCENQAIPQDFNGIIERSNLKIGAIARAGKMTLDQFWRVRKGLRQPTAIELVGMSEILNVPVDTLARCFTESQQAANA